MNNKINQELNGICYNGCIFENVYNQKFKIISEYWFFDDRFRYILSYDVYSIYENKIYKVKYDLILNKYINKNIFFTNKQKNIEEFVEISKDYMAIKLLKYE